MLRLKTFLVSAALLLIVTAAYAEQFDLVEYWKYTGESVTVSWDPVDRATKYEVKSHRVESGNVVGIWETTETEYTFTGMKGGHYDMMVRAGDDSGTWSTWSVSIDPAVAIVDNEPRGWRLYFHIAPPSIPVIE